MKFNILHLYRDRSFVLFSVMTKVLCILQEYNVMFKTSIETLMIESVPNLGQFVGLWLNIIVNVSIHYLSYQEHNLKKETIITHLRC